MPEKSNLLLVRKRRPGSQWHDGEYHAEPDPLIGTLDYYTTACGGALMAPEKTRVQSVPPGPMPNPGRLCAKCFPHLRKQGERGY